ncbi:MAG TPA: hypothetical protein VGB77_07275 [Abditibacteriaceae bacterium]|jgi:hypothetical protein
MNQNLKPILITLSVAAIVGGGLLWAANQRPVAANKTSNTPLVKAQNEGFVPGAYPGVMVRSVPLAKSQASAQGVTQDKNGLVRVLPGGQLPPRVVGRSGKSVSVRRQGQSRKGGTAANLPEHRIPRVTAHRDKNGKVIID